MNKAKSKILSKYKWASAVILLPIFLWPLIFFGTIFFFDDPNANPTFVWMLFIGVNAYPLYLIALYFLNLTIFKRFGNLGYLLPCLIIGIIGATIISQVISSNQFKKKLEIKEQERKDVGFIKDSRTYKSVNDSLYFNDRYFEGDHSSFEPLGFHYGKDKFNVYRQDKIIKGAKSASFRIVEWQWQRDIENYYFKGKQMRGIDLNSFEILDDNYSKDKQNVYYKTEKLDSVDPTLFKVISGTYEGNDGKYYYKHGKRINDH